MATYYAATNGTSGGTGAIGSPWDLQTGLTSALTGDDTLYLRGGTYTGRFASTLTGSSGHNITVRSYTGEWAVLDGYVNTTLATTINSSDTTIVLTDASKFVDGGTSTIDVTIGSEVIQLRNKSSNTFTNCLRARAGGQSAAGHTSGVTVLAAGQQVLLVQSGGYVTFRDFEIKNSNPTRVYTDDQSTTGLAPQYRRPEGLYLDTPNITAINLVIHDCREGIGFWDAAYGGLVYGCYLYNNGFVDPVRGHGHGIYTQNTNAAGKQVKETLEINNYATGMKMYGVAGTANHYVVEGVISANNGSPAAYSGNPAGLGTDTRESNIFAGTEQVAMDDITVQQSVSYHQPSIRSGLTGIGYDTTGSTNGLWQNNYLLGGIDNVSVIGWDSLIFRNNYVYASNVSGVRNDNNIVKIQVRTGSLNNYTFNNNTYYDNTYIESTCSSGATRRIPYYIDTVVSNCNGSLGSPLDYSGTGGWASKTTESGSTYTGGVPPTAVATARANIYDSTRANFWIWNPGSTGTISVSVAGIFNNGDTIAVHIGEAGTFPNGSPFQSVVVSGNAVTITTSGWSVATPTGSSFTPATVAPLFVAGILVKTASAATNQFSLGGTTTLTGKIGINT